MGFPFFHVNEDLSAFDSSSEFINITLIAFVLVFKILTVLKREKSRQIFFLLDASKKRKIRYVAQYPFRVFGYFLLAL